MTKAIHLRRATIDDLQLLESWMTREHVKSAVPDLDWKWKEELSEEVEWREQLIAELDSRPIGFVQIIDPAKETSHYWGDIGPNKKAVDIWIGEADVLGKGHGTEMMHLTLDRCFVDTQVEEVIIDPLTSNKSAIRFYQRIGFEMVERRLLGGDLSDIHAIDRKKWTLVKDSI